MASSPWAPKSGPDPTIHGCTPLPTGIWGEAEACGPSPGLPHGHFVVPGPREDRRGRRGPRATGPQ